MHVLLCYANDSKPLADIKSLGLCVVGADVGTNLSKSLFPSRLKRGLTQGLPNALAMRFYGNKCGNFTNVLECLGSRWHGADILNAQKGLCGIVNGHMEDATFGKVFDEINLRFEGNGFQNGILARLHNGIEQVYDLGGIAFLNGSDGDVHVLPNDTL